MKRTTITLPDDLASVVDREAHRRGTSVSEVVRTALHDSLVGSAPRRVSFAGICDDPQLPTGRDMEQALADRWADDLDRRRR